MMLGGHKALAGDAPDLLQRLEGNERLLDPRIANPSENGLQRLDNPSASDGVTERLDARQDFRLNVHVKLVGSSLQMGVLLGELTEIRFRHHISGEVSGGVVTNRGL